MIVFSLHSATSSSLAGIAVSPGTTLLRAKDIKHRLQSSRAKCIVSDSSTVDFVEEVEKAFFFHFGDKKGLIIALLWIICLHG